MIDDVIEKSQQKKKGKTNTNKMKTNDTKLITQLIGFFHSRKANEKQKM